MQPFALRPADRLRAWTWLYARAIGAVRAATPRRIGKCLIIKQRRRRLYPFELFHVPIAPRVTWTGRGYPREVTMGEAKRRKQSEANFGHVPKAANSRGLVVSPPLEIEGSSLQIKSTSLDPQELRFALLFWDRLVWPSSRAIHIVSGPDESFLESASILTRPDYTVNGDVAQGMAFGQIQAYMDLEKSEPGSMGPISRRKFFSLEKRFCFRGNRCNSRTPPSSSYSTARCAFGRDTRISDSPQRRTVVTQIQD